MKHSNRIAIVVMVTILGIVCEMQASQPVKTAVANNPTDIKESEKVIFINNLTDIELNGLLLGQLPTDMGPRDFRKIDTPIKPGAKKAPLALARYTHYIGGLYKQDDTMISTRFIACEDENGLRSLICSFEDGKTYTITQDNPQPIKPEDNNPKWLGYDITIKKEK